MSGRRRSVSFGLVLAGLLLLAGAAPAAESRPPSQLPLQTDWGGHLRVIGSAAFLDQDAVQRVVDRDPYTDGQVELRLKNRLDVGPHWSLNTHYELVGLGGDTRESASALHATGLPQGLLLDTQVSDANRFFDLTGILHDDERQLLYHRLDRLNLTYAPDWGSISIGRQALTWGDGRIFNPMDLFDPFAPTAIQRDYKTGEDMALLQVSLPVGDAQMLYLPRRDPDSGDLQEDQSSYAIKLHRPVGALEMDLMGARHYADEVVGLGGSGYLGEALWRINATYTHVSGPEAGGDAADDFLQLVANLDYAWIWGGKNFYGLVEGYYNQLGHSGDYKSAVNDDVLIDRLARGEMFTLGRYYLAGQLQVEVHPLVKVDTTAIVNLADPSGLLQPQLLWDVAENWQLILGGQWHWGNGNSEFGGFDVTTTDRSIRVVPADRLYLWLTYYF
jgi:hypothetical protein